MCYIDAHEKNDPSEHDNGISGGGYTPLIPLSCSDGSFFSCASI